MSSNQSIRTGGSSLPTTPALALLDAGAASRVVVLNASGEGGTGSYNDVGTSALSDILGGEAEGDFVVGDGAGGVQLASDAPAAVRAIIGVQDGPRYVPLCGAVTVNATQGTVAVGGSPGGIDPAASAITGRTQTWTLCVGARVTTGQTGTVELYDLVAAAVVATITVTSTSPGTEHTAAVELPALSRRYELRASVTGTTTAEYLAILNASIKQSWS